MLRVACLTCTTTIENRSLFAPVVPLHKIKRNQNLPPIAIPKRTESYKQAHETIWNRFRRSLILTQDWSSFLMGRSLYLIFSDIRSSPGSQKWADPHKLDNHCGRIESLSNISWELTSPPTRSSTHFVRSKGLPLSCWQKDWNKR